MDGKDQRVEGIQLGISRIRVIAGKIFQNRLLLGIS